VRNCPTNKNKRGLISVDYHNEDKSIHEHLGSKSELAMNYTTLKRHDHWTISIKPDGIAFTANSY